MRTMKIGLIAPLFAAFALVLLLRPFTGRTDARSQNELYRVDPRQDEAWRGSDLEFFLHGTMSSEFLPERLLKAFEIAYPDLFPGGSLTAFGVTWQENDDLPLGFSRRVVPHLGNMSSIGINCAACHVGEVQESAERPAIRVLGRPSHFNIYAFSGAVAVAMSRPCDPDGMVNFLEPYLRADGGDPDEVMKIFAPELVVQKEKVKAAVREDPFAQQGIAPGELHSIRHADLELDAKTLEKGADLVLVSRSLLKLLRNIRTSLHIPEKLPGPVSTQPGPGRTDAFGVLAASFFNFPTRFEAPVKFGIPWNLAGRKWVHWDGNNNDPLARNLGAALGLGTPLVGDGKMVDFKAIERHTRLSEALRSPPYPFAIDREMAKRGAALYKEGCARCHDLKSDEPLYPVEEVKTDPHRAQFFDKQQADLLNKWVTDLKIPDYHPAAETFRPTGKYWASAMEGVWARSPYLHNGSVRTLWELLAAPEKRAAKFQVGARLFDKKDVGFQDGGAFTFDTSLPGNSNSGHAYGAELTDTQKREMIEYLKTR